MVKLIIRQPVFCAAKNLEAAIFLQAGQALILQVQKVQQIKTLSKLIGLLWLFDQDFSEFDPPYEKLLLANCDLYFMVKEPPLQLANNQHPSKNM